MRSFIFSLSGLLAVLAGGTSATVINVPGDYPTIQEGIDASADGDTVLVQPGTYVENINFNGHNIVLGSLFLTTGDTAYTSSTRIDGNQEFTVVYFESGEDSTCVITGFTIQNGYVYVGGGIHCSGNSNPTISGNIITENIGWGTGGGIYCEASGPSIIDNTIVQNTSWGGAGIFCSDDSNPIISDNIIVDNEVYNDGSGGGIYCENHSSAIITNNIIDGNWGDWGGGGICCIDSSNAVIRNNIIRDNVGESGGILCVSSSPVITDNIIEDNNAGFWGGGISLRNSDAIITDCRINENTSLWAGGGVHCTASDVTITNSTICRNRAENDGGGIFCSGSILEIINNTLSENFVGGEGGGISIRYNSTSIVMNTILWENAPTELHVSGSSIDASYSDIRDGWEGEGNINTDPLLIDPFNDDYNICAQSPCIDAGNPEMWDPDSTRSDIGVYYPEHPECEIGHLWYVSIQGDDTNGDGSFENPFRTIQHAIDDSYYLDTVLVLNGVFVENIIFHGKNILLSSNYIFSQDTLDILDTIIDGDSLSSVVTFESCNSSAAIVGFTIRNGSSFFGGGVYCLNNANPMITNNLITVNFAFNGGGIYCDRSCPTITNNKIYGNTISAPNSGGGGGISCFDNSDPLITGNIITENIGASPFSSGGGIKCSFYSNPTIKSNLIGRNSVKYGGGIYCVDNSVPSIGMNTIHENSADSSGGGIYCLRTDYDITSNIIYDNYAGKGGGITCVASEGLILNNTISENTAFLGGGLYCELSDPIIANSIFWADNADYGLEIYADDLSYPTLSYCNIQGGWPGEGNIDIDPLFRDPENSDFHLMSSACGYPYDSPCIDAGDPDILDSLLDCSWGLGEIRSDMGAYGGGDSVIVGIDQDDIPIPHVFSLFQSYPNPFNAATVIRYALAEPADVRIEVYDILGRRVETLSEEKQQAGYHQIVWNAGGHPSGMYFYRIQAGDYSETRKMLLLK